MQVNNIIITFISKTRNNFTNILFNRIYFIDIRIFPNKRYKLLFGEKMDLSIIQLFLQASDNWCCQNNISNGTEPYDQYFFQDLNEYDFKQLFANIDISELALFKFHRK